MAEAILRAYEVTEQFQARATKRGLDIYKPRIIMVTDGRATDSAEVLVKARQRIHECDSEERGAKQIAFSRWALKARTCSNSPGSPSGRR